ncbi:MAG: hypothetical protein ACM34N_13900 [Ignavibacteria bacterium]
MHKIILLFVTPILIFCFFDLTAQTTNPNCKWVGTVESTFLNPDVPQRKETIKGTVIFEYADGGWGGETYHLKGGIFTWSVEGGGPPDGCVVRGNSITFFVDSVDVSGGDLLISEDGKYNGDAGFPELAGTYDAVHTDCKTYSADEPPILTGIAIGDTNSFIQDNIMAGSFTAGLLTFSWNLHKESGAEVKLQVESNQYDSWLPTAGKNEDEKGNLIVFTAKLAEPDGSTPCVNAKKFVFQLSYVSQEPGVALNFPKASLVKRTYDIHFTEAPAGSTVSPNKLTLETEGGSETLAEIYSFDWGGWATLKVIAYMPDGDSITGFLSGHPDITEIPIPKRSGNSKIADKWKQDFGVASFNDDDDDENLPEGDEDKGDGLTLYEEYRGFYEGGKHIFGDPKKKDLFVYTKVGKFKPGIQLFKQISELNVHYKLNSSEFDTETRLINFNYKEGPHLVPQHGLFLIQISGGRSFTYLGPPGNVNRVMITQIDQFTSIRVGREGRGREITNYLNSTVAHELGHAVRIEHHGPDIDSQSRLWRTTIEHDLNTRQSIYKFTEDDITVEARWENGRKYSQVIDGEQYVAIWGGQHSGYSDCVMRYDLAFAYIPKNVSLFRYIVHGNERTGLFLCDKKDDFRWGVNYLSRNPRSRYGSASNGECKKQICVNDKFH